jgi:hypothetical protein
MADADENPIPSESEVKRKVKAKDSTKRRGRPPGSVSVSRLEKIRKTFKWAEPSPNVSQRGERRLFCTTCNRDVGRWSDLEDFKKHVHDEGEKGNERVDQAFRTRLTQPEEKCVGIVACSGAKKGITINAMDEFLSSRVLKVIYTMQKEEKVYERRKLRRSFVSVAEELKYVYVRECTSNNAKFGICWDETGGKKSRRSHIIYLLRTSSRDDIPLHHVRVPISEDGTAKSLHGESYLKTMLELLELWSDVLDVENLVAFGYDNCSTNQCTVTMLKAKFGAVYYGGCILHKLNLL